MDIVLATRNAKKIEEIRRMMSGIRVNILSLADFDCPDVQEDADTFEGNAIKKAVAISKCTGHAAVSDDSGLEVDALGGLPGIYSARYAGDGADDASNVRKLLAAMQNVPNESRGARFVCCIALALTDGSIYTFEGEVKGSIALNPEGSSGFGYDPVFYPAGHGITFARMDAGQKDSMSHRRAALEKLKAHLKKIT
ncbi:MAG: RdgB/HAM1 family non-canonical purine NTP pyrophosphatase [Nitrospiraceae bacterium]|nr:RdgB/HAM1 family non-canonical purine NTP pyrophosphatase [Nitrospiraceae bacterium]